MLEMILTTYTFNENKFCAKFIHDYYSDVDLNSAFNEYYLNIVLSNSKEYNWRLFMFYYNRNNNNNHDKIEEVNMFEYLYHELFEIVKKQ
jgi:hypothetical protein